jgi:hypothetical protein
MHAVFKEGHTDYPVIKVNKWLRFYITPKVMLADI